MNVFEGARRVTHVVAGLTAAFWLWSAYENWSDAQSSRAKVERLVNASNAAEALKDANGGHPAEGIPNAGDVAKAARLRLLLDAERRGALSADQVRALEEARRRGLVPRARGPEPAEGDDQSRLERGHATALEYAAWIASNAAKNGTPEFDTVAAAYEAAKQEEAEQIRDARSAEADARERAKQRLSPLSWGPWFAGLYGFSWVIGWIVRGFMGIPRGSDRMPQRPPGTN